MFKINREKPAVVAPVREFTYFYAANFHTVHATHVSEAIRQVRENLSAKAEREAVLVSVK